ncbi:MAG: hypothetical protein WC790_00430 [Candidatus Paceibacterota bacterium]|jgi:hypothetical protein
MKASMEGRMPTVSEYQVMRTRAQGAGDAKAVEYFDRQIARGEAQAAAPTTPEGAPIPQGGSILNPLWNGVTFGFGDEALGVGGGIGSLLSGKGFGEGYRAVRDDVRQGNKEYAERRPYTSTGAEILSGLALPLGAIRGAVRTGSGLRTALGAGAAYGAGNAEGGVEERARGAGRGALTGAAGYGLLKGASSLYRAVVPRVAPAARGPAFQEKVARLQAAGLPVTPAERIASPQARLAERIAAGYTGGGQDVARRPQQMYSYLMERAGFDPADIAAGELSTEAVGRARDNFTRRYDHALAGVDVMLPDMLPRIETIRAAYGARLPYEKSAKLNKVFNDFMREIGVGRVVSGAQYKNLRSKLGKDAMKAANSANDVNLAPVFRQLRDTLDEAFRASAPPRQARLLQAVDADYAGYKILKDMAKNPDAISTAANRTRTGLPPRGEFKQMLQDYDDVLVKGYPKSSGTAENIATSSALPPLFSMARAGGARIADATRRIPQYVLPDNATTGFIAGQQAPGSTLEEALRSIMGGFQ